MSRSLSEICDYNPEVIGGNFSSIEALSDICDLKTSRIYLVILEHCGNVRFPLSNRGAFRVSSPL